MSTLLGDVLDIPKRAGAEDYVLRLTDSVGDAAAPERVKPLRNVSSRLRQWVSSCSG